jgi:endonuclease/exonuclease/phosphatase family metal-dependent hydrolase
MNDANWSAGRIPNTGKEGTAVTKAMYCSLGLLLLTILHASPSMGQSLSQGNGNLRVMTYNVDEGTDFIEIQNATTTSEFLVAVGQTISAVRATNPPVRMQAIAQQILAAAPTLVSLQELDQWSSGPFDPVTQTCGQLTMEFDMLQELMSALGSLGGHYQVAAQATQYAFPPTPGLILPSTFLCVQVIDFNVILARTDLSLTRFQWGNPQSGQFVNMDFVATPIGTIPLPSAWASVDASFNGKAFRFIGTHLQSVDAVVRELQGDELRAGPARTSLPVIVAMDSNAQASPPPVDPTYMDFIEAGYTDSWTQAFPLSPGFTCCQAPLVNNVVSQLYQRIDLILTLGAVQTQNIALFGATADSKTATGLWPSDHAGVAAQLVIETL